jgi:DNA polymerase (family 10)
MYSNEQIAQAFDNLASIIEFLDSKDPADPFRIRTYRKVANIIRGYPHNIYELRKEGKLEQIPGLGKQSRTKLLQFLET